MQRIAGTLEIELCPHGPVTQTSQRSRSAREGQRLFLSSTLVHKTIMIMCRNICAVLIGCLWKPCTSAWSRGPRLYQFQRAPYTSSAWPR